MSRENYHWIRVGIKTYEALKPLLEKANQDPGRLRTIKMNGFCEEILWQFARGELVTKQSVDFRQGPEEIFLGELPERGSPPPDPDKHRKIDARKKPGHGRKAAG